MKSGGTPKQPFTEFDLDKQSQELIQMEKQHKLELTELEE